MNFIDKLEWLLKAKMKTYSERYEYSSNNRVVFGLTSKGNINESYEQVAKVEGIKAAMNYLRDDNYKDPIYTHFEFKFVKDSNKQELEKFLELKPTNEDLFNLYKKVNYGFSDYLSVYLNVIEDKSLALTFFKYGHDYTVDNSKRDESRLKRFVMLLKKYNLSDNEWSDALKSYISNSKNFRESESTVLEVITDCVKDYQKCSQLIKIITNKEIDLENDFEQREIIQLRMNSLALMKKYNIKTSMQIIEALDLFTKLVEKNIKDMKDIERMDHYFHQEEHNFIIESATKDIKGIKIILNLFLNKFAELNCDMTMLKDFFNTNENEFKKMILFVDLNKELDTKSEVKRLKI